MLEVPAVGKHKRYLARKEESKAATPKRRKRPVLESNSL